MLPIQMRVAIHECLKQIVYRKGAPNGINAEITCIRVAYGIEDDVERSDRRRDDKTVIRIAPRRTFTAVVEKARA